MTNCVAMNLVDSTRTREPPLVGKQDRCVDRESEQLAESERRLRLALQASHLSLWDWDIVNDHIPWAPGLQTLTGLTAARFEGTRAGMLRLAHPDDRPLLAAALDRALAGSGEFHTEYRIVRPDGAIRWVAEHGQVIRDASGRPLRMIGTVADVTERRRTDQALRAARDGLEQRVAGRTRELALANAALRKEVAERRTAEARERGLVERVVSAAEDERRRIGHELHDTFGQLLSLMLLQLSALRRQCDDTQAPPAQLTQIDRLLETARQLDEALDRVESELRPPALDELGLEAALIGTVHAWTTDTGIPIELNNAGLHDLPLLPMAETTVYRVVQEALANVRRHARAHRVRIRITRDDQALQVTVADDGRGFDPAATGSDTDLPRSLGLVGMRERATRIGGTLIIESRVGKGTAISLTTPARLAYPPQARRGWRRFWPWRPTPSEAVA